MEPANLYLVRHGRTALNAAGLLRGHLDEPLDRKGLAEAEALARLFGPVPVDAVVTSPLSRARQTATPIAAATGAPLSVSACLIDRDYGPFAGRNHADLDEALRLGNPEASRIESSVAFVRRIANCLLPLTGARVVSTTVVVAHDAVNRMILAQLLSASSALPRAGDIEQRTGCWNWLQWDGTSWSGLIINALPGDGHRPGGPHRC